MQQSPASLMSAEASSDGHLCGERNAAADVGRLIDYAGCSDRVFARQRVHALTTQAQAATGRGLNLTRADLSGMDLSGFDLRHAVLNRASLHGTKLVKTDLTGASLVCAGLERTDFTEAILKAAYVHALAAQACTFRRADLREIVDGTGALFHGCDLTAARLDDAELAGTTFYQCTLSDAHVRGTDLHGAMFNECRMDSADLTRARLDDVVITRSSIGGLVLEQARGRGVVIQHPTGADGLRLARAHLPYLRLAYVRCHRLSGADLHAPGIDVHACHLPEANLAHADLTNGRWDGCNLDRAVLTGSVLTGSSWLSSTAVEAEATNATGEGLTATECTFSRAVLTGFAGRYATFRNCTLRGADLRGAYLYRSCIMGDPPASACLVDAQLDGANLAQAYLAADFSNASIRHAWATYARVNQSIFDGANLSGTSLFHASAVKTIFTGAQLSGQRGAMFADRCPGLVPALRGSGDTDSERVAEWVEEFGQLLRNDLGKST
ncbi:MAG: pentapeptide repeat-containing protein [Pseudonocardiaceae bacterium]